MASHESAVHTYEPLFPPRILVVDHQPWVMFDSWASKTAQIKLSAVASAIMLPSLLLLAHV